MARASARGAACLLVEAVAAPAIVTTAAAATQGMPTETPARALPGTRRSRTTSRATTRSATIPPRTACPDSGHAIEAAMAKMRVAGRAHAGDQRQRGGVGDGEADHEQHERRAVDRQALVGGEDQPQRDDDGYGHPGGGAGRAAAKRAPAAAVRAAAAGLGWVGTDAGSSCVPAARSVAADDSSAVH